MVLVGGAEKKSEPGSQTRKGKFVRGKEGDGLKEDQRPPFHESSYTPPMTSPLKARSRSQRSGI